MKNLILTIALSLSLSGVVTGQIQGVHNYTETTEAVNGVESKVKKDYILKFDYMTWGVYDLGNVLEETARILTANGLSFDEPDYDESTITIGSEGFYDIGISSLIFDGLAIRKAWGIDKDEKSFYAITLIASFSKVELLVAEIDK
jgi:hypothetical protein